MPRALLAFRVQLTSLSLEHFERKNVGRWGGKRMCARDIIFKWETEVVKKQLFSGSEEEKGSPSVRSLFLGEKKCKKASFFKAVHCSTIV